MDYQKITIEANGEEAELDCYLWSESPEYANGRKDPVCSYCQEADTASWRTGRESR